MFETERDMEARKLSELPDAMLYATCLGCYEEVLCLGRASEGKFGDLVSSNCNIWTQRKMT